MFVAILLLIFLWWESSMEHTSWDLENVDDLVQGSIEAPIGELRAAFEHFERMPQIEIVKITD